MVVLFGDFMKLSTNQDRIPRRCARDTQPHTLRKGQLLSPGRTAHLQLESALLTKSRGGASQSLKKRRGVSSAQ